MLGYKRKGQAMVELLLLMALVIPMASYLISYTKTNFIPKVSGWLEKELRAQIRYAYDYNSLTIIDDDAWENIEGNVPIEYKKKSLDNVHPLQKVLEGWR